MLPCCCCQLVAWCCFSLSSIEIRVILFYKLSIKQDPIKWPIFDHFWLTMLISCGSTYLKRCYINFCLTCTILDSNSFLWFHIECCLKCVPQTVADSKMIIEFLNVFPSFGWRDTWEGDRIESECSSLSSQPLTSNSAPQPLASGTIPLPRWAQKTPHLAPVALEALFGLFSWCNPNSNIYDGKCEGERLSSVYKQRVVGL